MGGITRESQRVTAADGREICYAEWGEPDGFPILLLHGTPGCRLNRPPDDSLFSATGTRLITYDRAGYGRSERKPGRSVVDCVRDVEAVLDQLGIDRCAVTGSSGGGPHVLAVAARLADRVVRARCNVSFAPYRAPGLDFFAGMDPLNVREFGWALEGEERLAKELSRELDEMHVRITADATKFLGEDWELDESDREILANPAIADQNRVVMEELVSGGPWGWVDDSLAFTRPWGFDVDEISVPVQVTYGARDVLVPAGHGAWLAQHVPGAEVIVDDIGGHLTGPDKIGAIFHWLVTGQG